MGPVPFTGDAQVQVSADNIWNLFLGGHSNMRLLEALFWIGEPASMSVSGSNPRTLTRTSEMLYVLISIRKNIDEIDLDIESGRRLGGYAALVNTLCPLAPGANKKRAVTLYGLILILDS